MEKFRTQLTLISHSFSIGGMVRRNADPNFVWKILISVAVLCALVIGLIGYLAYRWASSADQSTPTIPTRENVFSAEELREVILRYKGMQSTYNGLLRSRPEAPLLGRGIGADVVVPISIPVDALPSTLETAPLPGMVP